MSDHNILNFSDYQEQQPESLQHSVEDLTAAFMKATEEKEAARAREKEEAEAAAAIRQEYTLLPDAFFDRANWLQGDYLDLVPARFHLTRSDDDACDILPALMERPDGERVILLDSIERQIEAWRPLRDLDYCCQQAAKRTGYPLSEFCEGFDDDLGLGLVEHLEDEGFEEGEFKTILEGIREQIAVYEREQERERDEENRIRRERDNEYRASLALTEQQAPSQTAEDAAEYLRQQYSQLVESGLLVDPDHEDAVRFRVNQWFHEGGVDLIYGASHTGKTKLAAALAAALAAGRRFMGYDLNRCEVLILCPDDLPGLVADLRVLRDQEFNGASLQSLGVHVSGKAFDMSTSRGRADVRDLLRKLPDVKLVVMDAMSSHVDQLTDDVAEGFVKGCKTVAKETGVTFVPIHHAIKSSPDVWQGSQRLYDHVDGFIKFSSDFAKYEASLTVMKMRGTARKGWIETIPIKMADIEIAAKTHQLFDTQSDEEKAAVTVKTVDWIGFGTLSGGIKGSTHAAANTTGQKDVDAMSLPEKILEYLDGQPDGFRMTRGSAISIFDTKSDTLRQALKRLTDNEDIKQEAREFWLV